MFFQIIAIIATFFFLMHMRSEVEIIGKCLGFDGALAWSVPTFLILISIWILLTPKTMTKGRSKDQNLYIAVAVAIISILTIIYQIHDVGKIILEISRDTLKIAIEMIMGTLFIKKLKSK